MTSTEQAWLREIYLDCCRIEIQSLKPGNVSIYSHGHGMHPKDFFQSAEASAPVLCQPGLSVGERIHLACRATRSAVGCNTNLGILLLAAPLIKAFELRSPQETLRQALQRVLSSLTVEDAEETFRGICIASPGGLGQSEAHDVHEAATVTLLAAMGEASERDTIARQYINAYSDLYQFGVREIGAHFETVREDRWEWRWAALNCYLKFMSTMPDSHVFRKHGQKTSDFVMKRAEAVESRIKACENRSSTVPLLLQFDTELKRQEINPGTSADLTVVSLVAYKMEHLISQR